MLGLAVVLMGYGLGCVPTGYLLVRAWTGKDLRKVGSGSTGARNAGRVLGRKGFLLTLLGDAGKGAFAMAIANGLHVAPIATAATLVATTAGHVWPLPLRFSGGRGVAVAIGALVLYEPRLLAVPAAAALIGAIIGRRYQAGGLVGFAAMPFVAWLLGLPIETLTGIVGMCFVVLFAHRTRIGRSARHEENGTNGKTPL